MNAKSLKAHGVSNSFWGYLQMMSHQAVASTTCKIFEREDRHERTSIPAIIDALPQKRWSRKQEEAVVAFAYMHGVNAKFGGVKGHLRCALCCFECSESDCLTRLREFRNKHVAHSQHGFPVRPLPSIESFDSVFEFANGFYRVVSESLLDIGVADIESRVGRGAIRIMQRLGIAEPKFEFD